jgi:hypothetical protein
VAIAVIVAALAAVLAAGEGGAGQPVPGDISVQSADAGEVDRAARLLAGLRDDLPAREWRARHYTRRLARAFEHFEAKVGAPMQAWAADALAQSSGDTVFYPFSGADFPTARRMYPNASRYVLVAMQRGGPPPRPEQLERDEREAMLAGYEPLLTGFLRRGFFKTEEMNDGTRRGQPVRGITGLLMAFAAREGFEVLAVTPIDLDAAGDVVDHAGDRARAATWDSVRLSLRRRSDGQAVALEYLRVGLSNMTLKPDAPEHRFIAGLADERVILKAASHLPQDINFSAFTGLVLAQAPTIVQDETGVAYDDLTRKFAVELYGSYAQVNLLFDDEDQTTLIAAYKAADRVPRLPFHVGYRKGTQACMLVATRAPAGPPSPVSGKR